MNVKKLFLKFWHSNDEKVSLVRDIFIALIAVLIILSGLWMYTGQWFSAPMVAIESGSMMHIPPDYPEPPFGKLGTIDAGDMVLLVKVNEKDDIITRGSSYGGGYAQGEAGHQTYWEYGDVVIYRPYGDLSRTMIIHRAMCWVEYNEEDKTYTVGEYGLIDKTSITIPELGLHSYKPSHSGFITRGDNNPTCDQLSPTICNEPIKIEWVTGIARGEIPWVGTINLFFNDLTGGNLLGGGRPTIQNVYTDCTICLVLLIGVLISIPVLLDVLDYRKSKKKNHPKNPYLLIFIPFR